MGRHGATLVVLLAVVFLAGCATSYGNARMALAQGRYEEAASGFEDVLARHPDRLDALVGLGVARYTLGAFDEATTVLTRAVAQAPKSESAQLYLGLSHLQKGEDGAAEEHLEAFLELKPNTQIRRQADRALKLLRGEHLSPEMRAFIAASLDDEAEWARAVRAAELAQLGYPPPGFRRFVYGFGYGDGPCFLTRRGYLFCY